MRQPESNPLRKELARSQQAGTHPDADVLSAFAEGSLLAREREGVLAHLALCVRCREVLRIATDAAPEPVAEAQPKALLRPVHPPLRSWLPWVAAAACILVVSSVVLLHEQKKPAVESAKLANTQAARPPAAAAVQMPPAPETKIAPHKTPNSVARPETTQQRRENSTRAATNPATLPAAPSRESRAQVVPPQAEVANSGVRAASGSMVSSAKRAESPGSQAAAPVGEAQGAVAAKSSAAFADAAPAPMMHKTMSADATRPHWRINELGQLERALGSGAWQPVPMHDASKLHVVSVSGSEVWAGGENSRLEHSNDSGATWESVPLPAKNGHDHVLTHIRFQTPQEGMIDAEDGTSWKTTDGGRSWK